MEWYDRKIVGSGLLLLIVAIGLFYGIPYLLELYAPPAVAKYTTGLNAKLRIQNGTSGAALTGTDVTVQVFASGENPLAYKYIGTSVASAMWDSNEGAWVIGGVDVGTYELLVTEPSTPTTMHPTKTTITVPGTDEEDREVWVEPGTVNIYNIATVSMVNFDVANLTKTKGPVSAVTQTYDGTLEGINGTDSGPYGQGDYWRITYDISISPGVIQDERVMGPIRVYFTNLKEQFTFDQVLIGGESYSIGEDDEATDDGYSGLYVSLTGPWVSGDSITLQLYVTQYSGEAKDATGHTLTLTVVGQYNCLNPLYRTWSDVTQDVPCKDV